MSKRTTGRKQVLSIAIDPVLVARIDELADALNQSRSGFIERLLREAVEAEGDAIRAFQHPVLGPALLQALSSRDVLKSMAEVIGGDLTDAQLLLFREAMAGLAPASVQARAVPLATDRRARRRGAAVLKKQAKRVARKRSQEAQP
jgi:hypothetical protein